MGALRNPLFTNAGNSRNVFIHPHPEEHSTQGQFYECVNQSSTIKIRSKLDPVVTQLGGLLDKYCRIAENVTETTEFWNNVTESAQDWKAQRSECGDAAEDVEGFCKWASECILDTALGRAKKDLPLDVVSYNVDLIKLSYAAKWRDFPETLPRSCNVLFLRYDDATGSPWSTASTDEPTSPADTLLICRFTLFALLILGRLLEL
ncbi:hypothetical protein AAVH_20625 [Aphelenchoides avenae]|nr:hypothetical protein AAVH_20625 [Aphelenchus avenae]